MNTPETVQEFRDKYVGKRLTQTVYHNDRLVSSQCIRVQQVYPLQTMPGIYIVQGKEHSMQVNEDIMRQLTERDKAVWLCRETNAGFISDICSRFEDGEAVVGDFKNNINCIEQ